MASAETATAERFADCGEVDLCYETFGDPSDPAMLLVMGLGTQMLGWREGFCRQLVERGFFVIRYDNRDSGRSTHFDDTPPPSLGDLVRRRFGTLAYTLDEMADDGMGLLDHLGIETAHVVGASMGGMIGQVMAVRHPGRVLSLTSIMSSTGRRGAGRPALQVYSIFAAKRPRERDAYVERQLKIFAMVGSTGFDRDVDEQREMFARSWDRDSSTAGRGRQLASVLAAGDRTRDLDRIEAPTLVIHGTVDRLVGPSGGVATARAIRGARLMLIDGMGHDLPPGAWSRIIDAIVENAARAAERGEATWQAS